MRAMPCERCRAVSTEKASADIECGPPCGRSTHGVRARGGASASPPVLASASASALASVSASAGGSSTTASAPPCSSGRRTKARRVARSTSSTAARSCNARRASRYPLDTLNSEAPVDSLCEHATYDYGMHHSVGISTNMSRNCKRPTECNFFEGTGSNCLRWAPIVSGSQNITGNKKVAALTD
eukprot:5699056-Pleurochrysis_carterae.AAC.3